LAAGVSLGSALLVAALALAGCRKRQVEVERVEALPYPACESDSGGPASVGSPVPISEREGAPVAPGDAGKLFVVRGDPHVLADRRLYLFDSIPERTIVERFQVRDEECLRVIAARLEWARQSTDTEIVYDAGWSPLRAWKRMTIPGSDRADGHADIRRYELRGEQVTITRRGMDGTMHYAVVQGSKPNAIIGSGRGLLTAWIRRAKLDVGAKVREPVLDIREMHERIRDVTLKREPDLYVEGLGRTVRVYTIFGREPFFADENDVVMGDLAGLRPAERVAEPLPAPAPLFGDPDPRGTP
jgi:hypothetical protein